MTENDIDQIIASADWVSKQSFQDSVDTRVEPWCGFEKLGKADPYRKYGITRRIRKEMCDKQDGKCAICKSDKRLVVDHDHKTGKVRALLCGKCNCMLGHASDNPNILLAGIQYLKKHKTAVDKADKDVVS